jgi:antitoxin PrlF
MEVRLMGSFNKESDKGPNGKEVKDMNATLRSTVTAKSKLSSRGQVVLPLEIRKAIGAVDGDEIIFKLSGDGKGTWEMVKSPSADEVFGILNKPHIKSVDASDEEVQKRIYKAIANEKASGEGDEEEEK